MLARRKLNCDVEKIDREPIDGLSAPQDSGRKSKHDRDHRVSQEKTPMSSTFSSLLPHTLHGISFVLYVFLRLSA